MTNNAMRKTVVGMTAMSAAAMLAQAAGAQVRISAVSSLGATNANGSFADFVQLYNAGTDTADITGWSVQVATATASSWTRVAIPGSVTVPPKAYFLIRFGTTSATGVSFTPDATTSTTINNDGFKVALVNATAGTAVLSGTCPVSSAIVDFLGVANAAGTGANCFEGAGVTPGPATTSGAAIVRNCEGNVDTNVNSADFRTIFGFRPTGATGFPYVARPFAFNPAISPASFDAGTNVNFGVFVDISCAGAPPINVVADLSSLSLPFNQVLLDNGTGGDAVAGDGFYSVTLTVPALVTGGAKSVRFFAEDAGGFTETFATGNVLGAASQVKIARVYGGGASFSNGANADFVELYNDGSLAADLSGYSIQIASDTGSTWTATPIPDGTIIPAGGYYFIRFGSTSATGLATPTPDLTAAGTSLISTGGKVALRRSAAVLSGTCPLPDATVTDFLSYGGSATLCENSSRVGATVGTQYVTRRCGGSIDTDTNAADFFLEGAPGTTLRTSSSPVFLGGPSISSVLGTPATNLDAGAVVTLTASIDLGCAAGTTTVSADASSIGAGTVSLLDNGVAPDVTAGDGIFTRNVTVGPFTVGGGRTIAVTATDSAGATNSTINLTLVGAPSQVRISRVSGAGAGSSLGPNADFVELYNAGSTAANLSGYSLQLSTATGSTWTVVSIPDGATLVPGGYYLIRFGTPSTTTGLAFADPDLTNSSTTLVSTGNKIALQRNQVAIAGTCPTLPGTLTVDFLGYGNTVNCAETVPGDRFAPHTNTTVIVRKCEGTIDTNNNFNDFELQNFNPAAVRNSLSAPVFGGPSFAATAASPAAVFSGGSTLITASISACGSTGIVVTADLSSVGGSPTAALFDDGTNGDVTPGDNIFSLSFTPTGAPGARTLAVTTSDSLARTASSSIGLTINGAASNIRISQVSGMGAAQGTAGPASDYVEIYNPGPGAIDLTGYSLQVSVSTGSTWNIFNLPDSTIIPANRYYLFRIGGTSTTGVAITADQEPTTTSTALTTSGRVAMVANQINLGSTGSTCPIGNPAVMDFLGFGSTATCFEGAGAGPSPAAANLFAIYRICDGAVDTNNNNSDFSLANFNPRNLSSPPVISGPSASGGLATPNLFLNGSPTVLTATASSCANPISSVTVDLTSLGGAAAVAMLDNGVAPDAVAGDGVYTRSFTPTTATPGPKTLTVTATDTGTQTATTTIALDINAPAFDVRISATNGNGGSQGTAGVFADFIEFYNAETVAVDLTGYAVQVTTLGTSSSWSAAFLPDGFSVPAQSYFLLRMGSTSATGRSFDPDLISTLTLGGVSGKLALTTNRRVLTGTCPLPSADVVDFVGYGTPAAVNCFEGTGPAPAQAASTTAPFGLVRRCLGAVDTDDNSGDFTSAVSEPRNLLSGINTGGVAIFGPVANPGSNLDAGDIVTVTVTADPACGTAPFTITGSAATVNGGSFTLLDNGVAPDAVAGDNVFTGQFTVGPAPATGNRLITLTSLDALSRAVGASFNVNINAPANNVKISQLNGSGSLQTTDGPNADYVELFNPGPGAADMTNYSLQISSTTGSTWTNVPIPAGTIIPANSYYLVRFGTAPTTSTTGYAFPFDLSNSSTTLTSTGNKIALTRNQFALSGTCPLGSDVITDFLGTGTSTCFETAVAPTHSGSTPSAVFRFCGGSVDTNNNLNDFSVRVANPRFSGSAPFAGGPDGVVAVSVPASAGNGEVFLLTADPIDCGSTIASVVIDLSSVGGSPTQAMFDDGTNGDITGGDGIYSFAFTPVAQPLGAKSAAITVTDTLARTASGTLNFNIIAALSQTKISAVQGLGGGQGTAGVNIDFIELYNAGSAAADLTGYSLQIASSTGTTWTVATIPAATVVPAGRYLLLTIGPVSTTGVALGVTADVAVTSFANTTSTTSPLAATNKVALVANQSPLSGACPIPDPAIVDFIGYGTGANCREGVSTADNAAGQLAANQLYLARLCRGAQDTNLNANDYVLVSGTPRNSASPANPGGPEAISASGVAASTGESSLVTARVAACDSMGLTVTANVSIVGGPAALALLDNGVAPDATAGDGIFSASFVVGAVAAGSYSFPVTATDSASRTSSVNGSIGVVPTAFALKISEVYGFGDFASNGSDADYVELYNAESSPVDVAGYAVQVSSTTGSTWQVVPLTGTIPARGYLLVRLHAPDTSPTGYDISAIADVLGVNATALTSSGGKVALARTQTALSGSCPLGPLVVDFVGIATTANCSETTPRAIGASTDFYQRNCEGASDTNNNSADFTNISYQTFTTHRPENSSSPANPGFELRLIASTPSSIPQGETTTLTVSPTDCNTGTTPAGTSVVIDLTALGGSAGTPMVDDGTNGDVVAGDGIFTVSFTSDPFVTTGAKLLAILATADGGREAAGSVSVTVTAAPLGACCEGSGPEQTCSQRSLAQCAAVSGFFLGTGSSCLEELGSVSFDYTGTPVLPTGIPDFGGGVLSLSYTITDTFAVIGSGGIAVNVGLAHDFAGDLRVTISNGTVTVPLVDRVGSTPTVILGDGSNYAGTYRFSSNTNGDLWAAAASVNDSTGIPVGTYRPTGSNNVPAALTDFAGQPLDGTWTLTVSDRASGTVGTVSAFSIESLSLRNACCRADFNRDGILNDDDLGEFITSYFEIFAGPGGYAQPCPDAEPPYNTDGFRADFTLDCTLNDDDLGGFITAFFAGCPE